MASALNSATPTWPTFTALAPCPKREPASPSITATFTARLTTTARPSRFQSPSPSRSSGASHCNPNGPARSHGNDAGNNAGSTA